MALFTIKVKRKLGLERHETVWSLPVAELGINSKITPVREEQVRDTSALQIAAVHWIDKGITDLITIEKCFKEK